MNVLDAITDCNFINDIIMDHAYILNLEKLKIHASEILCENKKSKSNSDFLKESIKNIIKFE